MFLDKWIGMNKLLGVYKQREEGLYDNKFPQPKIKQGRASLICSSIVPLPKAKTTDVSNILINFLLGKYLFKTFQ